MILQSFKISNGAIFINNEKIELPFPVAEAINHMNYIVVRIEVPVREMFNNNVYGFTLSGKLEWQIEPSPYCTQENKPFVSIYVSVANDLIASNWNGIDYKVDTTNGCITTKIFRK